MVNVAELLKEASYGMELYSTIFGVVYLKGVSDNTTIAVYDKNQISMHNHQKNILHLLKLNILLEKKGKFKYLISENL